MPALRLIVVPVDFSPGGEAAARYAAWLASRVSARLRLVHALPGSERQRLPVAVPSMSRPVNEGAMHEAESGLADLATRLARVSPGTMPEAEVLASDLPVPDAIVAAARHARADLIVMATHGGSRARRMLFGSVADDVVRMADCPVLTVK